MSLDYANETLDAVALVLRDVKSDFEERFKEISELPIDLEAKIDKRFTSVTEKWNAVIQSIDLLKKETADRIKDVNQYTLDVAGDVEKRCATTLTGLRTTLTELEEEFETHLRKTESEWNAADLRENWKSLAKSVEETQKALKELTEFAETLNSSYNEFKVSFQDIISRFENLQVENVDERTKNAELLEQHSEALKDWKEWADLVEKSFDELHAQKTANDIHLKTFREEYDGIAEELKSSRQQISILLKKAVEQADLKTVEKLLREELSEKQAQQTAAAQESLDKAAEETRSLVGQLQDLITDNVQEIELRISGLQERTENFSEELAEKIEARAEMSDRMLTEQAQQFIGKLAENIRGERGPRGFLSRVQRWVEDYQFPELALVCHRSGLWQALRDTSQEPGIDADGDWQPVAAGIEEVSVALAKESELGSHLLTIRDSFGREHVGEIEIPIPRFHKTWDAKRRYRFYDSVVEDGHRWLAIRNNPQGAPSKSEDWVLFGMRGARGPRGARGESGPRGMPPAMNEILEAYAHRAAQREGTPIASYRGGWRYGADYVIGDLVQADNGVLALCCGEHRAEKSPTTAEQLQWVVFSQVPAGDTQGALQARVQAQENQIAALTAQVKELAAGTS